MGLRRSTVVFTVANDRLAAHAAVLFDDLARWCPSWKRALVSTDPAVGRHVARRRLAGVLGPRDIGMPECLAFQLCLPESTALSSTVPWAFDALFSQGFGRVVYLSPLVRCYSRLTEFSRALALSDALLVARALEPPADCLTTGLRHLQTEARFDSGLVGLANTPAVRLFVRWCKQASREQWLRHGGDNDGALWRTALDLCPTLVDRAVILRDPSYQVGLWNLQRRELANGARGRPWRLLSGRRLRTFNFEGVTGASTEGSQLSLQVWPNSLRRLRNEYDTELERTGLGARHHPSGLERVLPIPPEWRSAVLASAAVKGALLTAESYASAGKIVRAYLRLPDRDHPDLPGVLAEAYRRIPGLWRPEDTESASQLRDRLLAWYEADGKRVCRMSLAGDRGPASLTAGPKAAPVNVFGYFTSQSGLAEAARSTARALGKPLADGRWVNYDAGSPSPFAEPGVTLSVPHARPKIDIVHVNCEGVPLFYGAHPEVWSRDSYKIGYWLWELETLPADAGNHASLFDEIWCASRFNMACFERLEGVTVRLAPLLVNPRLERLAAPAGGHVLQSPFPGRRFVYLTLADVFSCPERKNPLAAIEAYVTAFPSDNGDTGLLVKLSNTGGRPDYLERLRQAAGRRRDIRFLLENLDSAALAQLIAGSAALVSLHTTEGYGLPIAEALALGRPVIATGYGGNVDFCKGRDAYLIAYETVTLVNRLGPYAPGTQWAQPDVEAAARAYRDVYLTRRHSASHFAPRVAEFNHSARHLYRVALDAALARAEGGTNARIGSARLRIAIFGAGSGGNLLARQLLPHHDVVCFLDNGRDKIGRTLAGLPIRAPALVRELDVDKILIGSMFREEIRDQLLAAGVTPDRMNLFAPASER